MKLGSWEVGDDGRYVFLFITCSSCLHAVLTFPFSHQFCWQNNDHQGFVEESSQTWEMSPRIWVCTGLVP